MRSTNIYQCVIFMACAMLVTRMDGVPKYASTTPQVGDVEMKLPIIRDSDSDKMTSVNNRASPRPNANVLEQIKQGATTCKIASDLDSPRASQSSKVEKTAVDNNEWDSKMTMDAGTALVAAALSLSDSKLAEIAKDAYCFQNNLQRAQKNRDVPENISDVRNSRLYSELPEELSILHNFREDLKLDTPKDRLIAGLGAAAEYKAWKDHKMDRSEWKYLDPDLPNVKFIEEAGGRKEAVYNRHTGMIVNHGNNQGTYNYYDQNSISTEKVLHGIKDVGDWGLCGTPADNEKISAKWSAVLVSIMQGQELKEIDTSKLEELLKEGIVFLKDLIAKGKRATNSQIEAHNQRVKEILAETMSIAKRIDSLDVSDEEKKSIAEKVAESVKGLNSQFDSLNKQARSMGLVRGATTEEQVELIKDVQSKSDVASVDSSKSQTKSINSKSNDVRANSDFDVCKCAVPADRDFRCTKCGKMSRSLAPHRDKEFERMLNKRK